MSILLPRFENKWNVYQPLLDFFISAKKQFFSLYPMFTISITSGYRSFDEQRAIRAKFGYASDSIPSGFGGLPMAARPGHSMHEKGLALDFVIMNATSKFYVVFLNLIEKISDDRVVGLGYKDLGHVQWNKIYIKEVQ